MNGMMSSRRRGMTTGLPASVESLSTVSGVDHGEMAVEEGGEDRGVAS